MKYVIILLSFILFVSVSLSQSDNVLINEICVKPLNQDQPRWIEIKNGLNKKINIKGYSLYDSRNLIYKFKTDTILKPNEPVFICFENSKNSFVNFKQSLPSNVKSIKVKNKNAMTNKGTLKYRKDVFHKFQKDYENIGFHSFSNISQDEMKLCKNTTKKFMLFNKLPDSLKDAIKGFVLDSPTEYDELALFNNKGELIDYVSWGNNSVVSPGDTSKNANMAYKKNIWYKEKRIPIRWIDDGERVPVNPNDDINDNEKEIEVYIKMRRYIILKRIFSNTIRQVRLKKSALGKGN